MTNKVTADIDVGVYDDDVDGLTMSTAPAYLYVCFERPTFRAFFCSWQLCFLKVDLYCCCIVYLNFFVLE